MGGGSSTGFISAGAGEGDLPFGRLGGIFRPDGFVAGAADRRKLPGRHPCGKGDEHNNGRELVKFEIPHVSLIQRAMTGQRSQGAARAHMGIGWPLFKLP